MRLCVPRMTIGLLQSGFPIRTSPDCRPLPAPRSLSQAGASFIASACQGIRRGRFFAWPCTPGKPLRASVGAIQARSGFMCFKFSFDKIKSKSPFLFSDLSLLRFKLEHCPKAPQEGTLELVIFFNQLSVLSMNTGHRVPAPKRFFCFALFPPVSFGLSGRSASARGRPAAVPKLCGQVVELNGFEPLTPCLQGRCSTS